MLKASPPARPQAIQGSGGAEGILVDDSHTTFAVAARNPDGTLQLDEVKGIAAAKSAVERAAVTKSAPGQTVKRGGAIETK